MKHRTTSRFWACYDSLPADVRALADAAFVLLRSDMRHSSLRLKKVSDFWSVRIGLHYRALAIETDQDLLWFWIGHHSEYDRLVGHAR